MKRHRLGWLATAVVASLVFAACSSGSSASPAATGAASVAPSAAAPSESAAAGVKQPPYVIGVSNDSVANPFRVQMIHEIEYYASQHPELISKLIVLNAGEDTNKQLSDVQDLISQGVDGIVLSPNSSTAFDAVLKDAKAAGIPVATYNMTVDDATNLVGQVAPPFQEWEKLQTQWLVDEMGGKGNVIALRGIAGTPVDALEWAGAQEVLTNYPDVKIICTEYANWDYGAAKTAVQNCLANHPEVNGILSVGDAMTWAAGEAMAAAGYDLSKVPMIGIGGGNGALKWWANDPKINAEMIGDRTDVAVFATEYVLNALQGKAGAEVVIPTTVVTSSNIKEYAQPALPDNVWLIGTQLPVSELEKQ